MFSELKETYLDLRQTVASLREEGKIIYPPQEDILNAFDGLTVKDIKAVIIGQDPYINENQAHGLAFSVKRGVEIPASLNNIFKELESDLGIDPPNHGCLEAWRNQGVLLLNRVLTVEAGQSNSHVGLGWQQFTDGIVKLISEKRENIVFILWGNNAKEVSKLVDSNKHLVLQAAHPSPLSASRGFFGCRHFSKCNDYLKSKGLSPINWKISNL